MNNLYDRTSQKGSALIMAIVIMLVIAIIVPVGTQLILTSFNEAKHQQYTVAEADNVARSGIVDALQWFRRQAVQPVRSGYPPTLYDYYDGAFYPRSSTNPVDQATIDETIGLVKEYALNESGTRYARYEIKRQQNPSIYPYDDFAVHDITEQRLHGGEKSGEGLVWYLPSTGYVYLRRDPSVSFNVEPNKIVAKSKVSTEIRRITLLTQNCACIVNDGGTLASRNVQIYKNGRITGGASGMGCARVSGYAPYTSGNGYYDTSSSGYQDPTPSYVFGLTLSELKTVSDYFVSSVNSLPNPLPDMSLVYISGDAIFDSSKPLRSSGILFVDGNLTIAIGSNSLFSGVIYVTGTATIYDPCLISGCVIAYNSLIVSRSDSTDTVDIQFDPSIISAVMQQICQYREIKSSYRSFTGIQGVQ